MSYPLSLTADQRIGIIRVKVARAQEHIEDLETRLKAFLDGKPYEVGVRADPQFPKAFTQHYVASVKPMIGGIPCVAGEVLQQLRSALDHLAWFLVDIGCAANNITLSKRDRKQIGFPIIDTDSPAQYESSRTAKVKGMTQAAIDAIDATKPYKGGNDCLWRLNQLNNIDKHRFLVAAGAQLGHIEAPRFLKRALFGKIVEDKGGTVPPDIDLGRSSFTFNIIPDQQFRKCPLEEGDELVSGFSTFLDKDEKVEFAFEIVFHEPGVAECEPMLPLLVQTRDYVNKLILSFKPYLA